MTVARAVRLVLLVVAGLLVAVVGTGLLLLDSRWGEERVRRFAVDQANDALRGELSIDRLSGSLIGGRVTLTGVRLRQDAVDVVAADSVEVRYSLTGMFSGLDLAEVRLVHPRVHVVQDPATREWNVANLTRSTGRESSRPSVSIRRLQIVDGQVDVDPAEGADRTLADLDATIGLAIDDERVGIDIGDFSGTDPATGVAIESLAGDVEVRDERIAVDDFSLRTPNSHISGSFSTTSASTGSPRQYAFDIDAKAATTEIGKYLAAVARLPAATVTIDTSGSLEQFAGDWSVVSDAGAAQGKLTGSGSDEQIRINGNLTARRLELTRWVEQSVVTGAFDATGTYDASVPLDAPETTTVEFDAAVPAIVVAGYQLGALDVNGTYRRDRIDGRGSGRAYGARFTGNGSWTTASRRFTADGTFAGVNAAALPERLSVPTLTSDLGGRLSLGGTPDAWAMDVTLTPSTVEGATIADGFTAHVEGGGGSVAYAASGAIAGIDPSRFTAIVDDPPELLSRAAGSIDAHIDLTGRGTTLDDTTLTGDVALSNASVAGIGLDDTTVHVELAERALAADLTANDVVVSEDPLGFRTGPLEARGSIEAHANVPDISAVRIEDVEGRATVALASAKVREAAIDTATIAAAIAGGVLTVQQAHVAGPDLTVDASGPVALAGNGASALDLKIAVTRLAALEPFVGPDFDLEGGVTLTAQVTGPADRQSAAGTFGAYELTAGPVQALSLEGSFDAALPELDPEKAVGTANVSGAFVQVSGTQIDELNADLGYDAGRIRLGATLAQGEREVQVDGTIVPQPEYREVHVRRLQLGDNVSTWRLPEGSEAVIEYGASRIAIKDLRLESGGAVLDVAGVLGADSAEPLHVTATAVPVAELNRLALGPYDLQGRLDADVTIAGALDAPNVDATLTVQDGSVEGLPFQRLETTAGYADSRVTLDMALDAVDLGRLTAAGVIPYRFGDKAPPAPDYDLTVESTNLALGFFDPLTSAVENLQGRGEMNVHVSGPSSSPSLDGSIVLSGGAFDVAATGVSYRALDADLTVKGQQLSVDRFHMEDDDGHAIALAGALNVPGLGDDRAIELVLTTKGVRVLDNEFGEVALTANLQLLGSLDTPLVSGTIHVDRGVVEISDLLDRLASNGYKPVSVEEEIQGKVEVQGEPQAEQAAGTPYDRASFSVTLDLPGNVVVRGRDLRSGSGPIGLGDVNITLGGALSIAKDTGTDLTIVGAVDVVRGQYQFQGRRFEIARDSEVRFQGQPANPALDVTATRVISGVTAEVHLTGTLAEPTLQLSSNPPLDEGDVLSLIVFNQPMNELGGSQRVSLASRAASIAAGAIATPIADSVAQALDLDVFEIQPTASAEGGASVRVGRQVSQRLFVGFSQEFGRDEVSEVSFEYRLNELLSIITTLAHGTSTTTASRQAEQAGIDLIFTVD